MDIKVMDNVKNKVSVINCNYGDKLSNVLSSKGIIDFPCGGKGKCGKCKVIIKEKINYDENEVKLLTRFEISNNVHLACYVTVCSDLTIVVHSDSKFSILSSVNMDKSILNTKINFLDISDIRKVKGSAIRSNFEILNDYLKNIAGNVVNSNGQKIGDFNGQKTGDFNGQKSDDLNEEKTDDFNGGNAVCLNNINILRALDKINLEDNEPLNLVMYNDETLNIICGKISSYGIAVDIGTTTVVVYLLNLISGDIVDIEAGVNKQRAFGHDVISRIAFADTRENTNLLQSLIVETIEESIDKLLIRNNIDYDYINKVVVVGNTVMNHLFIGADVKNLGKLPFTPQFLDTLIFNCNDVGFTKLRHAKVIVLNNISSFVGADIVSGIIDTNLDVWDDDIAGENNHIEDWTGDTDSDSNIFSNNILVDIGTNGEMVIACNGRLICCATAAGPAFEAANISCGVGSIEGAICKVYKENGQIKFKTIGDKEPIGICGTGLIDLVAYLLDEEIIDDVGYLEEDYVLFKNENNKEISITPKDIREVQLAKAAIAAGLECLIHEANLTLNDIDNIFVGGGFGNYLNIDSAIRIGLLPRAKEKIKFVGNCAGSGACKVLLNNDLLVRGKKIKDKASYLELSSSKKFVDSYVNNMYFL